MPSLNSTNAPQSTARIMPSTFVVQIANFSGSLAGAVGVIEPAPSLLIHIADAAAALRELRMSDWSRPQADRVREFMAESGPIPEDVVAEVAALDWPD